MERNEGNSFGSVEEQVWNELENLCHTDKDANYTGIFNDSQITTIFFQTGHMKKMLNRYPEMLFIDTTYCLNQFSHPIVVFMIADHENKAHCVAYAVVKDEKMLTFSSLYSQLLSRNPGVNPKTVVIDKDFSEINAVKQSIPSAKILLCRFHVCRALKDAVNSHCCNEEEKKEMRTKIFKLVYGSDPVKFEEIFENLPPGTLRNYMLINWYPMKESWASCYTKLLTTWDNHTNNFVERHNRELNRLLNRQSPMLEVFKTLIRLSKLDEDSYNRTCLTNNLRFKTYLTNDSKTQSLLNDAQKTFSIKACDSLKCSIEKKNKFAEKYTFHIHGQLFSYFDSDGNLKNYKIDSETCSCYFFNNKSLPCWHIIAYCDHFGVSCLNYINDHYKKPVTGTQIKTDNKDKGKYINKKIHDSPVSFLEDGSVAYHGPFYRGKRSKSFNFGNVSKFDYSKTKGRIRNKYLSKKQNQKKQFSHLAKKSRKRKKKDGCDEFIDFCASKGNMFEREDLEKFVITINVPEDDYEFNHIADVFLDSSKEPCGEKDCLDEFINFCGSKGHLFEREDLENLDITIDISEESFSKLMKIDDSEREQK